MQLTKLAFVTLACIVGSNAGLVTRRGNVVRSAGLERRQGTDVCFSEGEQFVVIDWVAVMHILQIVQRKASVL